MSRVQISTAREMAPGAGAEYMDVAPLADVLHEQLDYLIDHAAQSCAPGCADCARLQQVQGWLLIPFRGHRRARSSSRAA